MSDASESWLPVVGWEGSYEVSDWARVRSLHRKTPRGRLRGKVLSQSFAGKYLKTTLYRDGKGVTCYIHHLVAAAFIGPCPKGMEVRHGPAGRLDNRPPNLSYGIHIANCEDRARDGAGHAKLNRAKAAEIRTRVSAGESRKLLAIEYDVTESTINRIVAGIRWKPEPAELEEAS